MRFLIHSQYYPPEVGAPQTRLVELAQELSRNGFSVSVLTAQPSYPAGKIHSGYGGIFRKEVTDKISIYRSFIFPSKSTSLFPRLSSYFSFVISSFLIGIFLPRSDFIMTESPPLFLGITGYLLSRIKRAKWILNISDLWPESVVELGVIDRKSWLYKVSSTLEFFLYRKAWLVTGQSKTILQSIVDRVPQVETYHLSNGVDPDRFTPVLSTLSSNKITVIYAGLHGIAQGLEQVIEAARELQQDDRIIFSLVGDGPAKVSIMNLAERYALGNVHFYSPIPKEKIPDTLADTDIVIVPLKVQLTGAVPSKLYEAMAAGKPVILVAESEAAEIVKKSECGLVIKPGDIDGLVEAIRTLADQPAMRKQMGEAGRRAAVEKYDRRQISLAFGNYIKSF